MYLPGPTTNCAVRNMPRQSWKRAQKRHFPDITNQSIVDFAPKQVPTRKLQSTSDERSERRHYCNVNSKDHMKDFF